MACESGRTDGRSIVPPTVEVGVGVREGVGPVGAGCGGGDAAARRPGHGRKLATDSVIARCLPEYFTVVIAAIDSRVAAEIIAALLGHDREA